MEILKRHERLAERVHRCQSRDASPLHGDARLRSAEAALLLRIEKDVRERHRQRDQVLASLRTCLEQADADERAAKKIRTLCFSQ